MRFDRICPQEKRGKRGWGSCGSLRAAAAPAKPPQPESVTPRCKNMTRPGVGCAANHPAREQHGAGGSHQAVTRCCAIVGKISCAICTPPAALRTLYPTRPSLSLCQDRTRPGFGFPFHRVPPSPTSASHVLASVAHDLPGPLVLLPSPPGLAIDLPPPLPSGPPLRSPCLALWGSRAPSHMLFDLAGRAFRRVSRSSLHRVSRSELYRGVPRCSVCFLCLARHKSRR